MAALNKDTVMDRILNIEERNVSPNVSPNKELNLPNRRHPFMGESNGRALYYLDYLLRKRIGEITGTTHRIYKGYHFVCDHKRKTCKVKMFDSEIEARGDCFFHSALYNLGKKYFGPRGTRLEEIDNKENAKKFRQLLVRHYLEHNPSFTEGIETYMPQYEYVHNTIASSYAHLFNRSVCIFNITTYAVLSVDLYINKNALTSNIDCFILTESPQHYTTLKRKYGFKQDGLMDLLQDYELSIQDDMHMLYPKDLSKYGEKTHITIRDDLQIKHSEETTRSKFDDTIRYYMIGGPQNVYRLFKVDFPEFDENAQETRSPNLSANELAKLSEEEQIEYALRKSDPLSKHESKRAAKHDSPVTFISKKEFKKLSQQEQNDYIMTRSAISNNIYLPNNSPKDEPKHNPMNEPKHNPMNEPTHESPVRFLTKKEFQKLSQQEQNDYIMTRSAISNNIYLPNNSPKDEPKHEPQLSPLLHPNFFKTPKNGNQTIKPKLKPRPRARRTPLERLPELSPTTQAEYNKFFLKEPNQTMNNQSLNKNQKTNKPNTAPRASRKPAPKPRARSVKSVSNKANS